MFVHSSLIPRLVSNCYKTWNYYGAQHGDGCREVGRMEDDWLHLCFYCIAGNTPCFCAFMDCVYKIIE